MLAAAKHQSTRDIEKLVAELAPKLDVPARLRKLPEPQTPESQTPQSQAHASVSAPAAEHPAEPPSQAPVSVPAAKHVAEPQWPPALPAQLRPRRVPDPMSLSPRRYKLEFTIDAQLMTSCANCKICWPIKFGMAR